MEQVEGEKRGDQEIKKKGGRKGSEREPEGEKDKERFLLSSAVAIRDECIVDIDLSCRTEPARSFLQHSFIILAR